MADDHLIAVIVECAQSAIRKKESFFYARYQKNNSKEYSLIKKAWD